MVLGVASAVPAHAGDGPAFTATQEKGVTVYRRTHPELNFEVLAARQRAMEHMHEKAAFERKVRQQKRELAALQSHIQLLETQQPNVQKPKRRSRYGRSYYGNNRFFGPNGFVGNRHFSGASPQLPVQPHTKRRQNKSKTP